MDRPLDYFHKWTSGLNTIINEHLLLAWLWQIVASFCLDLLSLGAIILWIWHGKSWRPLLALALFYGTRALMQSVFIMPFPEGFFWEYPGIPSVFNSYGRQSDFFWSGHVGFMLIGTLELWQLGYKNLSYSSISLVFFEFVTLVVFRVHYASDLIAGLIISKLISHWCYTMAKYPAPAFTRFMEGE